MPRRKRRFPKFVIRSVSYIDLKKTKDDIEGPTECRNATNVVKDETH